MAESVRGRTAIVTGSSKGIGYAIAEALARAGANVVVSARDPGEVGEAARTLDGVAEGRVIGVPCDVRRHEDVRRLVARTAQELGGLDILVNNAGVGSFAPVGEMDIEQWQGMIETNLNGVFYCCHEAIPHLKRSDGGWIINIASLAGKNAFAGGAAYNASKFGLVGFSEALMLDLREDDVRVNYIMPGSVATHFNDHTPNDQDAWKIQPEDIAEVVMDLLAFHPRTLPSRIEVRPSRPPRK
ncbi:MAG: SDR family oxidoreductase [Gemmatimonadota bacterium]|nr:SDR family oxidoreductase [Gemmatimonadota bacterium]